jgi:hypothetical protein
MIQNVIKINDVSKVLLHCLKDLEFACEQLFFKMFFFLYKMCTIPSKLENFLNIDYLENNTSLN